MAEDRKTFKIKDGHLGEVKIADEVVAIIAGLAATEDEGCSCGSIERYCECGCGAEYCLRLLHPGSICESSGTRKISN